MTFMGNCCLYQLRLENEVLHVLFGIRQLTDCWRLKINFLLIRILLNAGDLHLPLELLVLAPGQHARVDEPEL